MIVTKLGPLRGNFLRSPLGPIDGSSADDTSREHVLRKIDKQSHSFVAS